MSDKIWSMVPALIGTVLAFALVRILMIYILLFEMAVKGLQAQ